MSVDYSAYFGIGYKVCESDELIDTKELEYGLEDYIDDEMADGFDCFRTGSAYSGDFDGTYLTINDPLEDGLDLAGAKERLDKEVERLKLETCSEFGQVGGLLVW